MKKNNKKGFFLSETMVVIAVVAVVLLGLFRLFNSVYYGFKESENYNTENAIIALSNIQKYFEITLSEKYALIDEMAQFIIQYDVVEFMDLKAYAMAERSDWNEVLHGASYEIVNLIKSRRHGGRRPLNPVTGETF